MYFRIASRYGNVKITLYYFVFVRKVVCEIKLNQNFPGQVWWHGVSQTLISSLLYNFYSLISLILNFPKFFEAQSSLSSNGTEVFNIYDEQFYVSFVTMRTTSLRSNTLYLHVYSYIRLQDWLHRHPHFLCLFLSKCIH